MMAEKGVAGGGGGEEKMKKDEEGNEVERKEGKEEVRRTKR